MHDPKLAPYLTPGPAQEWLLEQMDTGHARTRHGKQFGDPTSERFKERIRDHLLHAPEAYRSLSPAGHPAYLIVDAERDQVVWIAPHKARRATIFQPDGGVRAFVARKQQTQGAGAVRPVDIEKLRAVTMHPAQRTPAQRITSAARAPNRSAAARVP